MKYLCRADAVAYRHLRDERGFALPMTIFLVTMITIMLTSAFTRSASEHAVSSGSTAVVKAASVAQSGLQSFLADSFADRPANGDSVRYNVVNGYAWVVPQLMHVPADTMLGFTYILRSTGYYIEPNQGSLEQGKREVAQFVRWQRGIRRSAAWVAANWNMFSSASADLIVDGNDACAVDPAIPGIYQPSSNSSIPPDSVTGSPPEVRSGTPEEVAQLLGINWSAIGNGDWTPDWTTLAGAHQDTLWGSYLLTTNQEVIGDTSAMQGTGLLVVTGGIDTYGFSWEGIVIVGRDFDVRGGDTHIKGMLITGMDEILGLPSYNSEFDNASTSLRVEYNSCYVARALQRVGGLVAIPNAWVDNWAMY